MIHSPGIAHMPIQKIHDADVLEASDELAVEEPLEIRLQHGPSSCRIESPISVTMRTPGNDEELAIGFLFTEGIITDLQSVDSITTDSSHSLCISLDENVYPDTGRLQRHFYTSSSCGVCGKSSLEALRTISPFLHSTKPWSIDPGLLYDLPSKLLQQQEIFGNTGSLHAAAIFSRDGELLSLKEDIGRHNALDKLIGSALQKGQLPLEDHILLLSGRTCFELMQKAAMAGIRVVAAVGAPSSLAVEMAKEHDITLIGFLRGQRFNIYAGASRISI